MKVTEIFGPTIQGEGPYAGRPAIFIRLAGCKKPYCHFCDTKYSQEAAGSHVVEVGNILDAIQNMQAKTKFVVITGGEPLLQAREVATLCGLLNSYGYHMQIETSGRVWPNINILHTFLFTQTSLVVSPKFVNKRWQVAKGVYGYGQGYRKFVISGVRDLARMENFLKKSSMHNPERVYLMPEGKTRDEQTDENARMVWEYCAKEGFRFSSRLHTLLYGNKRGV